jgi:hypothetical protein
MLPGQAWMPERLSASGTEIIMNQHSPNPIDWIPGEFIRQGADDCPSIKQ